MYTMIEFTKAYEMGNPAHPEWRPTLHLGYKSRNGTEYSLKYGPDKFNDILSVLDNVKRECDEFNPENGMFIKEVSFHKGALYGAWTETFTAKRVLIYTHYRKEIEEYVLKYYKPYTPKNRPLYEKPVAEQYEDEKCNIKWVLRVPCYEAQEGDTGKGLRSWNVSEWLAAVLVRDGEAGQLYGNMLSHKNKKDGTPYKYTHVVGGQEKQFELTPEQMEAFDKYYDTLLKFVINPSSVA